MTEQATEGWVLAWYPDRSYPVSLWQHRDGRLVDTPDRSGDYREDGWYADPRMTSQPDKPEPHIEEGWWLVRSKNRSDAVFVRERRDGAWRWLDGAVASVEYDPVCRLTDEQAALLHEQAGGEQ